MNKTALQLQERVSTLLACGVNQSISDTEFDRLARAIFAFQYEHCDVYRAYCDQQKRTPHAVEHWKQIPAVPTSAFKDFAIACFPVEEAVAEFHTSGTTTEESGKHYFPTLALYDAAIRPNFAAHLSVPPASHLLSSESTAECGRDARATLAERVGLDRRDACPTLDGQTERNGGDARAASLRMLILTPSPEETPLSSLAYMMGVVMREFGTEESGFYVERGALCVKRLTSALREAEHARQPVILLGAAFAFVHLFDHLAQANLELEMANGSRAMETGGFKGRTREVPKKALYEMFEQFLGIPSSRVVNEYGMTELSTQFYDQTLREGRQTDRKVAPPWSRVWIINPNTGQEADECQRGLIRIIDLANLWSAMCVQSQDLGIASLDGFEILGRATGAAVRGCSLNAESLSSQ